MYIMYIFITDKQTTTWSLIWLHLKKISILIEYTHQTWKISFSMQLLSKETTIRDSYRTPMTPRYNKMIYFTIQFKSYIETKVCTERGQGKNMLPIFTPPEAGGGGATKYQKSSYSPWQRFQTIVQRAHKLVQDSVVYRAALGSPVITRLTRQAPLLHIVVDLLEASSELLYTYVSILILVQFQKYFVKVFSGQLFADLGELSFVDISRPV